MLVSAHRVHQLLFHLVQISAAGLASVGLLIAFVGVPAFTTLEGVPRVSLVGDSILWALLLVVFGIAEAVTVFWGEFGQAWIAALGLVLFALGFYPNTGHLVAPLVGFNVLSLGVLHGFDEWLIRF